QSQQTRTIAALELVARKAIPVRTVHRDQPALLAQFNRNVNRATIHSGGRAHARCLHPSLQWFECGNPNLPDWARSPPHGIYGPNRMANLKLTLVVACALIDADKRVLIAQRPPGKSMAGLWEFPGGKVEPGERPEATLIRELHEELGISVSEPCLAPLTFASHAYDDFHLLMPLYICRRWDGQ